MLSSSVSQTRAVWSSLAVAAVGHEAELRSIGEGGLDAVVGHAPASFAGTR